MARRKSYGFSFSWKRAVGISSARQKIARATGIPTTRSGLERKIGRAATSGCALYAVMPILLLLTLALILAVVMLTGCRQAPRVMPGTLGAPAVADQPPPITATETPADSAPITATTEQDAATTVYVTATGRKYHRDGCPSLARSKKPITLRDAKARGYTPCQRCAPPE